MKSQFAKIMILLQPIIVLTAIIVQPTLSAAVSALLVVVPVSILCWGFDSRIAGWERKDR